MRKPVRKSGTPQNRNVRDAAFLRERLKIARVKETVAARETTAWLEEVSPSVQKDTVKEGSKPVVTLQPSEEGEQNIYEIENLLTEAEGAEDASGIVGMVMPHRWTAGAMLILLGMVYLCSNHTPESVGNNHVKGVLRCWEDAPMLVSGRLPISWKVTEAVGTMTWCTWKGLRDPEYQLEDLGTELLVTARYVCETLVYIGTRLSFLLAIFAISRRVFPRRILRGLGVMGLMLALVFFIPMRLTPAPEINLGEMASGQDFRTRSNSRAKDGRVTHTPSTYGSHPLLKKMSVFNFIVDTGANSHVINDASMVINWTSKRPEECEGAFPGMKGTSIGRGDCAIMIYNHSTRRYRRQLLRDCAIIPGARRNLISGPSLGDGRVGPVPEG